jgi:DNA repair protein RadC
MAAPAPPHHRNLATPAALATERQRSVLARFLAVIEPTDGERLAQALLDEFRSLGRILTQTPEALGRILGAHRPLAAILLGARELIIESLRADFVTQPLDPCCPKLARYLMASMGSLSEEVLRILFLDSAHRLIADEQIQHGSVQHLAFYPRTIFRRAIEHAATGVILVHNHPSGDPAPSQEDIRVTRRLVELGRSLDITVIGHIVVTATRVNRVEHGISISDEETLAYADILTDRSEPERTGSTNRQSFALANAQLAGRRRQARANIFGHADIFGDPAWELLTDLFIHQCLGKKVAISALCATSFAPRSTTLRWINRLCDTGFAVKIDDPSDGRRQFVKLTPHTARLLECYFFAEEG